MTSPDGITWTPRTSAVDNSWSSVTYGNGLFVAVANSGTNNRVMTSPDGITWTPRTTPVDNSWIGVTYGNGLFVAVSATGTNDRVMTFSSNGIYYTYSYTVNAANGSTYIDGTATVSLSTTVDAVGNSSSTPTNNTFTIDTAGPTVALTYSANPAPTGAMTITATYSEAPTTTPNISINQPGTTDISNVAMSGSGTVYTYSYTVNTANGSTYIDGTATVSLSATTDAVGYSSSAPTNNTFAIDTVGPTATVTYSIDRTVKGGESLVITATFNKVVADAPVMKIGISGANTVSATNMTKVDTTHYTYTHTVGAGDGVATVALSVGTDLAGNVVTSSPTSGATFSVDNILPSSTIDAICSTLGNGCTGAGALADPQESYSVQSIKGTASDNEGGSGLSSVKISIKDTTTNLWYSGSSFADGTETYLTATGTTAWSFNSSAMALTIDHVYLIHVKSIDLATNEESPVQALSFKFVNSPPTVSNVTASQDSSGVVNISFDVSDIESSQTTNYLFYGIGATLNGAINSSVNSLTVSDATYLSSSGSIIIDDEIITYTSKTGNVLNGLTRGALSTTASSHNNASSVYAKATTVTGTGVGLVNVGTGKTMVWTAGTDIDGYENLSEVIKVVVNDGSTGSMIGSLVSATFAFDTLKPTAVVTFDAGIAGVTNSATITIPMPVDQSTVEYKISDDAVSQTNPTNSGWVTMTQSTTIPWTFDSDVEAKTIKYQYRDAYGNISNEVSISTLAPVAANSFLVQDSSNINISTYDMYIGWGEIVDLTGFSAYKIEYATSDDNVTYGSYTAVTADGMSNPTTNYYVHRLLNPNKYYKYRLGVVGTNGNVSVRAGAPIVAKPDGVQNYGEGGSGSEAVVITASKVENVVPVQGVDKNVTITYLLTDSSSASKTNPSYEAYLFYNIGVTLPSSPLSGDNLTVSDASKLKSSGFIQINNEIIKYTSKTGNVLSGLTRSTWPTNGTTRTTRTNTTFFSGTPVWIMASSATPVQITNTSIVTGQNGSIAWDTNSETTLSGSVYTNVGIRVLVHDNQTTESLSTQSDFSEIGILNTLDLNSPTISFSTASASGVETTSPVTATLNLSRAYPLDVSINYAVTGTATSGDDYTLASGTETITAGQTTKSISIPIINDAVSEFDETIIVTISSPTNARLGANTVFTYTIEDNLLPTLAFNALTSQSNEDVNTVNIPVSISAAYSDNVTFSYVVTGGTADGDSVDYLLANGTGTITAGNTSTDISLTIFDDSISESTETIIVTISNPTNAVLGSNQNHVYSILDNEIEVTSVTGGNIKSTSARITWTTDDFTNSLLEYGIIAPGTEGAYNLSKTNSEKVLNHSIYIDNLTPSTTYYFKTTSVNLDNEDTIVESSFTTTAGPVTTGVSSSAVTDTTATITWTTDIPASSYVNYSKDSSLASPTRFGTAELTTDHSVALTGLDAGSNYYYYVDGTDTDGNNGENANAGSYYTFTTAADQTAPVISAISSPIVTPTEVAIVWTTNELANGKVMYGTTSGSYTNETELISTPLINHLVTISGLTKVTKYYYVVVSADSNSNTTTSAEQNFTTGDVETVTVVSGGGGGGVMGVARELYDILLAENATYKSKLKDYDDKIPVISNIQINDITAFGALVSFETSEDTIVFIDYGKDESYGLIAADKGWSKIHTVKIYGLSLGTEYNFKISAIDRSNDTGYSDNQKFTTKFLTEDLAELKKIENVEQFQDEIESTIESILPSLVPPFIDKPVVSDITENSATITFRTNIKAYPIVSYAAENKYDATKLNPYDGEMSDTSEKKVLHTLSLVSLAPNTKYHVMVKAYSLPQVVGKSEDFVFTTEASKIQGSILDIKKDSFTVVWQTDEATSSIIEYKNLSTGKIARMVDDVKNISHSVLVENLSPGTLYQVNISGINDKGNIVEGSAPLNVKTSTDNTPPVITNLKVDSSLVAGRTDKVQVIVSWQTDEASTSTVYYEEGSGSLKGSLANKQQDEELTKNHVVIMTSLKPGTVYRFTVESKDDANNIVKPPIRTIITPKKAESIVDVIFKNFNETFNFINNVR
ncbi:MAG: fibronectin type III domain-containing protein [Burkholderiales bacterium]|nr:fibronectin type III domain-containing protein [Burkholderiales bacterium]